MKYQIELICVLDINDIVSFRHLLITFLLLYKSLFYFIFSVRLIGLEFQAFFVGEMSCFFEVVIFFLAFDFFVGSVWSFVFFIPPQRPMTSDFEGFLYQISSITLFSYLNSWERASIFPFQCWLLNKGTTGTNFYNVFGMTRSLTANWTWDLPHSKPALYH